VLVSDWSEILESVAVSSEPLVGAIGICRSGSGCGKVLLAESAFNPGSGIVISIAGADAGTVAVFDELSVKDDDDDDNEDEDCDVSEDSDDMDEEEEESAVENIIWGGAPESDDGFGELDELMPGEFADDKLADLQMPIAPTSGSDDTATDSSISDQSETNTSPSQ